MKSAEMTETLIRAIQNYAEYYLAEHDESALYERLSTTFNLSDADIDAIGLGRLIPESDEPDEKSLEEFRFRYTETWAGIFTVSAHNLKEAMDLFEKQLDNGEIDTIEGIEKTDSDWYPLSF